MFKKTGSFLFTAALLATLLIFPSGGLNYFSFFFFLYREASIKTPSLTRGSNMWQRWARRPPGTLLWSCIMKKKGRRLTDLIRGFKIANTCYAWAVLLSHYLQSRRGKPLCSFSSAVIKYNRKRKKKKKRYFERKRLSILAERCRR